MPHIFFLAGEPSGDANCARVVRSLRERHPDWRISALGGRELRAAGANIVGDTSGLGVIGFASALQVLPRALRLKAQTLRWLDTNAVDLAVPCDWGAFNGRLLPELQTRGGPVLYFFPPRSWQKDGAGGLQIAPFCERIATPFEWSAQRLNVAGAQAEWVGHPLLEEVDEAPPRAELRREWGIAPSERLVALLPGSRALELQLLAPVLAQAARLLEGRGVADRFLVAVPHGAGESVRQVFEGVARVVEGRATDVLKACDAAIVKSGTATLQAAASGAPQVIVYDVPPLLRAQWKLTGMARRVPFVGMPNIILGRVACRELLGPNCRPELIARETATLLEDAPLRARMSRDYQQVRRALGSELPQPATRRVTEIIEELVTVAPR